MRRLVVARLAQTDLRDIARYTEERWGTEQKNRYMSAIGARVSSLCKRGELGRPRPELGKQYRSLITGSHVVIYRMTTDEIIIVRVLHRAMDIRRFF